MSLSLSIYPNPGAAASLLSEGSTRQAEMGPCSAETRGSGEGVEVPAHDGSKSLWVDGGGTPNPGLSLIPNSWTLQMRLVKAARHKPSSFSCVALNSRKLAKLRNTPKRADTRRTPSSLSGACHV